MPGLPLTPCRITPSLSRMSQVAPPSFCTQRVRCDSCCDSPAGMAGVAFAIHVALRVAFQASCVMRITTAAAGPLAKEMCDRHKEKMVVSSRGPGLAVARVVLPVVGIIVLSRVLLSEEWKPTPSVFPRFEPPDDLLPSQEDYVTWAGDHVAWVIRGARVRSVRFLVVAVVSGMSALAITLAVALHAPAWVSAVLGFIAAAGQFVQGLSRDREQSHLAHQEAVRLQKALRDFHIDAGELSGHRLRERFKEFKQDFDRVKEEYGLEAFKVRGQEPPQIGAGSR